MPPRRSTRAASATPTSKAVPKPLEKVVANRPKSQPPRKRAPSPERAAPPPSKRSRTTKTQKPENDPPTQAAPAPRRQSSKAPASKKAAQPLKKQPSNKLASIPEGSVPQQKPYFNPLPVPPLARRPGLQLFAWGAGNFGQFGMGPDVLGELDKPKRNMWVDEQIQKGTFGEVGAGFESVAAGGLHTLLIDEKGTVRVTS